MPSRWRVTVYLSEEIQKALEQWATNENRSTSNMAATILINAIKEYQDEEMPQARPTYTPIPATKTKRGKAS
ncbi:MAG: hypothetical protein U7123_17975 [Potamolinea sp.]